MHNLSDSTVLLGIDYGLRYTGLSLGNLITYTASPLKTIQALSKKMLFSELTFTLVQWKPQLIVVGQPSLHSNKEMNQLCEKVAKQIQKNFSIPCLLHTEDLTSWEAKTHLTPRTKEDELFVHAVSAQIILQSFLDEQASERSPLCLTM